MLEKKTTKNNKFIIWNNKLLRTDNNYLLRIDLYYVLIKLMIFLGLSFCDDDKL